MAFTFRLGRGGLSRLGVWKAIVGGTCVTGEGLLAVFMV